MAKSDLKTFILVYNTLPIPLGAVSIKPSLPFFIFILFFLGGGGGVCLTELNNKMISII